MTWDTVVQVFSHSLEKISSKTTNDLLHNNYDIPCNLQNI